MQLKLKVGHKVVFLVFHMLLQGLVFFVFFLEARVRSQTHKLTAGVKILGKNRDTNTVFTPPSYSPHIQASLQNQAENNVHQSTRAGGLLACVFSAGVVCLRLGDSCVC